MKKSLCVILFTASMASTYAQSNLPEEGDHVLQLNAKPFLDMIGNMFNQSTNNDLYYGTDFTYKKFISESKVRRHRIYLAGSGYNTYSEDVFNGESITQESSSIRVYYFWGTEYRKSLKNVQGYIGYEVGGGFSGATLKREYSETITEGSELILRQDYPNAQLGTNLLLGADYFFARNFSVGVAVRAGLFLDYDFGSKSIYNYVEDGLVYKREIEAPSYLGYSLSSGNLALNFSWIF